MCEIGMKFNSDSESILQTLLMLNNRQCDIQGDSVTDSVIENVMGIVTDSVLGSVMDSVTDSVMGNMI